VTDDFAAVAAGDTARLVAMMRATDAWPGVRAAREWVLDQAAAGPDDVVLDVGSGPGTFGALAAARGARTVDVDLARAMLSVVRRTNPVARVVCGEIGRLPVRAGAATLSHAERVLQWTADPEVALAELHRATAPGGRLAVTDTDWSRFRIAHDDATVAGLWSDAALGWVPHARVAASLPDRVAALGLLDVAVRHDTVVVREWDPDDPGHADGPPGLPLRSIAAGAPADGRRTLDADVAVLAARARRGEFRASLSLVTVLAERAVVD